MKAEMRCPNCGEPDGRHFAPPSLGEPGFYTCDPVTSLGVPAASVPPEPPTLSENDAAGRLEIVKQYQAAVGADQPPFDRYDFVIPDGARGLSLSDYRYAITGAVPALLAVVAALGATVGPCYVMGDGECISPFKCAHGDGLSLDEFAMRVTDQATAALRAEVALRDGMIDSLCADVVREAAQARALRIELAEARAEAARVRKIHLARHTRLSEAVGLAPGYSADATVDRAIELARAARAASGEDANG